MSTFNQTSSYNRTYERKVVEEAPRIRVTTQTHQPFSPVMIPASYFPSFHFAPTSLSSSGSPTTLGTGGTVTNLRTSSDSFQATLDVSLFAPEDLKVSVIGNFIVVEAKHDEKQDDFGFIERHFVRKFNLPKGVNPEAVTSNLTADGALTIEALPPKKEASPSRTIPIKVVTQPGAADQSKEQNKAATPEAQPAPSSSN
ncbi:hypothetical protein WR25_00895 [Diploscapter pachys]|uniref:SHSP domain-containing protein n=1 Tax=Diploscapter pachys TaxID=2018661 RepID=A0A2A2KVS2_9BILA|nr:hypothetical protein WR25_00895 [Diploscapter pachys]